MRDGVDAPGSSPLHVAVIMDGNGRWATSRGRPRADGHREGGAAVRRTVEAAPGLGIGTLTLFAFSSENWKRPRPEVSALMALFASYLARETSRCVRDGVRLSVVGRRDRLPSRLVRSIASAEERTLPGSRLWLRLAVDYSARADIARSLGGGGGAPPAPGPDVDLLIRTGGEKRLSDFLLWECAWAELRFVDTMWPDFSAADLAAAVADFRSRQRRFGGLPEPARVTAAAPPRPADLVTHRGASV